MKLRMYEMYELRPTFYGRPGTTVTWIEWAVRIAHTQHSTTSARCSRDDVLSAWRHSMCTAWPCVWLDLLLSADVNWRQHSVRDVLSQAYVSYSRPKRPFLLATSRLGMVTVLQVRVKSYFCRSKSARSARALFRVSRSEHAEDACSAALCGRPSSGHITATRRRKNAANWSLAYRARKLTRYVTKHMCGLISMWSSFSRETYIIIIKIIINSVHCMYRAQSDTDVNLFISHSSGLIAFWYDNAL